MATRFVFVGNRRFVLQEMLKSGLEMAAVIGISNTHLERDLKNGQVPGLTDYATVASKAELLSLLSSIEFDVLVSNGCPYILPVSKLPAARYVNIHPSCLPDLRGVDPVIGSVLYARDAGATCHVMDDGIDTGPVISQVRIPYTDDLDVTSMYQLSFVAEQRAFSEALQLDFRPQYSQAGSPGDIAYKRSPTDWRINFSEPNNVLLRKVKAFNNRSQGCEFIVSGRTWRFYQAMRMHNPFLLDVLSKVAEGTVALSYENSIVFRKDGEVLRFMDILPSEDGALPVGTQLFKN